MEFEYEWVREPDCLYEFSYNTQATVAGERIYCPFHRPYAGLAVFNARTQLWEDSISIPEDDSLFFGLTALGNRLYLFGSANIASGEVGFGVVQIYDITNNVWSRGSSIPDGGKIGGKALAYEGKIYLMGGYEGTNPVSTLIYSPDSDSWDYGSDMPYARGLHTAAQVGSKIHLFCGMMDNNVRYMDTHSIYDCEADTWTIGRDYPWGLEYPAAASHGTDIWVVGGVNAVYTSAVNVYDTVTDTYRAGPSFPFAIGSPQSATIGNTLYVMGGGSSSNNKTLYSLQLGDAPEPPDPEPGEKQLGITIPVGKSVQASVSSNLGDNDACVWSTDAATVAAVSAQGVVSGRALGETILHVSKADEDFAESMPVRVVAGEDAPNPPELNMNDYFFYARPDDNGELKLGARRISECDC